MSTLHGNRFFFIGIGGIGMSGLARYFRRRGALVAGYDRTPSDLTNQLQREGIAVQFNEDPRMIPDEFRDAAPEEIMVVRTPAVPLNSPLLAYWEGKGARILKRAEVLGLITRDKPTIAVAGTHGKTTVSTMVAHLLTAGKVSCNAFLGGIAAAGGLIQRRMGMPDATVLVLQGLMFVVLLVSETLYGRIPFFRPKVQA